MSSIKRKKNQMKNEKKQQALDPRGKLLDELLYGNAGEELMNQDSMVHNMRDRTRQVDAARTGDEVPKMDRTCVKSSLGLSRDT